MANYRVPFFGTLLIEADSIEAAVHAAYPWTVSMRCATHGVDVQPVPEEIKAVEFCIERSKSEDVTAELAESVRKDEVQAKQNTGGQKIAETVCNHSYYVGLQAAWESCEFERMRPESE